MHESCGPAGLKPGRAGGLVSPGGAGHEKDHQLSCSSPADRRTSNLRAADATAVEPAARSIDLSAGEHAGSAERPESRPERESRARSGLEPQPASTSRSEPKLEEQPAG